LPFVSKFPDIFQPNSYNHGGTTRWFCAENNHVRSAWISGLRLKMVSVFVVCIIGTRKNLNSTVFRIEGDLGG